MPPTASAARLAAGVLLFASVAGCREDEASLANTSYHVASTATAAGDGSAARPWNLATALAHPSILLPGDTIWLHGGTYRGQVDSKLRGLPDRPIIVRQWPDERATIDGRLIVEGQHTTYWGFEVTNSDSTRTASTPGSENPDSRPMGVYVLGPGTRLINLVIHDAGNGVGLWSPAVDAEVYGSIIYNNGWQGPDRGHGHGIYSQNATGTKRVVDNVIFQQFRNGLQFYGSDQASLAGLQVEGNVSFNNGTLARPVEGQDLFIGGRTPASRVTVTNNHTYRRDGFITARLGYDADVRNEDLTLADNYFVGVTQLINWRKLTVRGNTFTGAQDLLAIGSPNGDPLAADEWDENRYIVDASVPVRNSPKPFHVYHGTEGEFLDFAAWRTSTGLDGESAFEGPRPTGTRIAVRPNRYEPGRAHVVVYNWARLGSVDVDVSAVLRRGDRWELRSVHDLFGAPLASGTYEGGALRVPMTAAPPAAPIGGSSTAPPATAPEFNVFLLTSPGRR